MGLERRSYVIRIDTDPAIYLWTGFGTLDTPADAVDPAGASWRGAGGLLGIPSLKALIGGVAERVEFRLSGVDASILPLVTDDADEVDGAEVRVGSVEFDQDWQLIDGVSWEWRGIADQPGVGSAPSDEGRIRTITLSVASADTRRANPQFQFWTDQSQRLRSADDAFCDHVAMISNSVTRRFGPK